MRFSDCDCVDQAFAIAKTMPGLRHLKLTRIVLHYVTLIAILEGCPLLESLDVQKCHRLYVSRSLRKWCHEQIKVLQLPDCYIDDSYVIYYHDDGNGLPNVDT
jgi:F-box/leucine-rich repeat protein 2/20